GLDQAGAGGRVQRRERVARRLAVDHAALFHQRLGAEDAALTVLVVDQRQPARVFGDGLVAPARRMGVDDAADAVGVAAAGHRTGRAGVQVGQQRDRLFTVPWAFDSVAAERNQLAQLGRRAGGLDLEVRHLL